MKRSNFLARIFRSRSRAVRTTIALALTAACTAPLFGALVMCTPDDDPFRIPETLLENGLFACRKIVLSCNAVVRSKSLAGGSQDELEEAHIRSNQHVALIGRGVEVHGDVISGPHGRVFKVGKPLVTGEIRKAPDYAPCQPIKLGGLYQQLLENNDNDQLPRTDRGKNVLRGWFGDDFVLRGNDGITIPAGTYVFRRFQVHHSVVRIEGPVQILVIGDVDIDWGSSVNDGGNPFHFRLWSSSRWPVRIQSFARMRGFVYAPKALVQLRGGVQFEGGIHGRYIDLAGGVKFVRVVDDVEPSVTITSPEDGETVPTCDVNVTGQVVEAGSAVTLTVNGETVEVQPDGYFEHEVQLTADDQGLIRAELADETGSIASSEVRVNVALPQVELTAPAPGSLIGQRIVDLTGTSGTATEVTVNGVAASVTDGQFSAVGVDLGEDGLKTVTVQATNCGGTTTEEFVLDLDTTPPTVSIDSPTEDSLFGQTPITVTGPVVDAHLASVTVNGVEAVISGDRFTAEGVPLSEGPTPLIAIATDVLGLVTESAPVTVRYDSTAPTVVIESPVSGSVVNTPSIDVTGTASDANLASVTVNGVAADVSGDSFTATGVSLTEGDNSLVATAIDQVGLSVDSQAVVVVLDTLPPTVTIDELPVLTSDAAITVTGTVSDPHLDTVTVNGVVATVTDVQWVVVDLPLSEGQNSIVATAVDTLNHSADSAPRNVERDSTPPTIIITDPANGAQLDIRTVTVTGTVSDPNLQDVRVGAVVATVDGNTFTAVDVALPEGESSLIAVATDTLDNTGQSDPVQITVDTLPPIVSLDPPPDPLVGDPLVTVSGQIDEPHLESLTVNGQPAAISDDTFTAEVTLVEGMNTITATARDTFNHEAVSNEIFYQLDTTGPVLVVETPEPGELLGAAAVDVTGTVVDDSISTVTVNGYGADKVGEAFSLDALPLNEGPNTITVVASDIVGNSTTVEVPVDVDSLAPVVTITTPTDGSIAFGRTIPVAGTVVDSHLASVTVNGVPAAVVGTAFSVDALPLGDGSNTITAIAIDALGREGSATVTVMLDNRPPVVTLDSPSAEGCLEANQLYTLAGSFSDASPATGQDGQLPPLQLEIVTSDGASTQHLGVLAPDGRSWSLEGVSLGAADGIATVTLIAADALGNTSRVSRTYRMDGTAPEIRLEMGGAPFPGVTAGPTPPAGAQPVLLGRTVAVRAFVSDGTYGGPPPVELVLNGAAYVAGTLIEAEGDHLLVARAIDCAGHETVVHAFFRIDLTAPVLVSTVPAEGAVLPDPVEVFSGEADGELASATVGGKPAAVTGMAFTQSPFAWREGENTVAVTLVDPAGNRAAFELNFTVRTIEPTVDILEGGLPVADGALFTRTIAPTITTNDEEHTVTATLNGAPFTSGSEIGTTGDYTLAATASDTLGRSANRSVDFRVDLEAGPSIAITSPADGDTVPDSIVDVLGTVSGTQVSVTVNGLAATVIDGSWSVVGLELDPDVVNTIIAIATDDAGRTARASVSVYVRSSGPQLFFLSPADNATTNRDRIDVLGVVVGGLRVAANGTATVTTDGGYSVSVPVEVNGEFRAIDVPLGEESTVITAQATDSEGRTGEASVIVSSDRNPPSITILADGQPLEEGTAFGQAFMLEVSVSDPGGVALPPSVRLNGAAQDVTETQFSVEIAEAGGYLVSVIADDEAGNQARLDRSFVLQTGGCSLTEIEPPDGSSVAASAVTIRGDCGTAAAVSVRIVGTGEVYNASLADGTFLAGDLPLPDLGSNDLELICVDAGDAEQVLPLQIHRLPEGEGPQVVIESPDAGDRVAADNLTVTGTVSDEGVLLTVSGIAATLTPVGDGTATFNVVVPLAEGPNVLAAHAVDSIGRVGDDRIVVWRDVSSPRIQLTNPESGNAIGPTSDGRSVVDVTGLVDIHDERNLVSVVVSGPTGSVTAVVDPETGSFIAAEVPLDALIGDGEQTITATATDSLGNVGTASIDVIFDATGPSIKLAVPADLTRIDESVTSISIEGDAWGAEGAQVAINGTTLELADTDWEEISENRRHADFDAAMDAPGSEGGFGIIAVVTELDGRRATDRRLLYRDATAPEALEMIPAEGATQVDANSIPMVLFSEPILISSLETANGLTLTRLATGEPVVGQIAVAGNAVAFVPGAALAGGESYRFTAGLGITDLVGHPLSEVEEATFEVTAGSGLAPVLDMLDPIVCPEGSTITINGTATANAQVAVRVSGLTFTGFAEADGRFSVPVPVTGNGYHLLHVGVIDRQGDLLGPEALAVVRVDCSSPTVRASVMDRVSGVITVTFSEEIDLASATIGGGSDAIRLRDADGPPDAWQSATVQASGEETQVDLVFDNAADAWWRNRAVRLEVGAPLADLSGNPMVATYATHFMPAGQGQVEGSFLFGEAYNDATGRPLEGAGVDLYPAGANLPGVTEVTDEPIATAVTDSRGRYTMITATTDGDIAAGRYVVHVEHPDFTPVMRRLALEPAVGAIPFDVRLTPLAASAGDLNPSLGGTFGGADETEPQVVFDPAALPGSEALAVRLTELGGQGLPDFLPLGWSPVAAAELRLEDAVGTLPLATAFAAGTVQVDLPLPAWTQSGDAVLGAQYDTATGVWVTLVPVERLDINGQPIARLTLTGPGAVVATLADSNPAIAPLQPTGAGQGLLGASAPTEFPELTAEMGLDPPVVPPTGRATARVVARSVVSDVLWPSGLAVQAYLEEQLFLSSGEQLVEAPFSADLVLYRPRLDAGELGGTDPSGAGVVEFAVSPSERATQVLLDVGYENIRLYPFPEQIERGLVLGAPGGVVSSPDGVELELPEGALSSKTVVKASLLAADDPSIPDSLEGFDILSGVRLDFSGRTLARAATLSLPAPAGTPAENPADPRLVLGFIDENPSDGLGTIVRLVVRIGYDGDRLVAAPEAGDSGLPLSGIVREGTVLVLSAQAPIGYATGFVRTISGHPLERSRVIAAGLGTADVTSLSGRYAVVTPAADPAISNVSARHPNVDEQGSVEIVVAPGAIVVADITVQPQPPEIDSLQPTDGAVNQPVGSVLRIRFTKEIDPSSVNAATVDLQVANSQGSPSGVHINGTVSAEGTDVVFKPTRALPPGAPYVATFNGGVFSASGVPYAGGPVEWRFSTQARPETTDGLIHPERFHVSLPVDGVAEIWTDADALPQGTAWSVTPYVDRAIADPTVDTCSWIEGPDTLVHGSGPCTVGHPPDFPVTIHDTVWVKILDPDPLAEFPVAAEFPIGPFTFTTDEGGEGFVAPAGEAVSFTTTGGVTVDVPEGAFDEPTPVTITPLDPETLGVETPQGLALASYLDIDFEGTANKTLRIKVPAPQGTAADAQLFVGAPVNLPWGRRLRLIDVGGVLQEPVGDFLSNDPSLQPEPSTGAVQAQGYEMRVMSMEDGITYCSDAHKNGYPKCFMEKVLVELMARQTAAFFAEIANDWTLAHGHVKETLESMAVIYEQYADSWIYVPEAHNWDGQYILPVLKNEPLHMILRDRATGWIIDEYEHEPVLADDSLTDIGWDNKEIRPMLIDATPFELIRFQEPNEDTFLRLNLQLEVEWASANRARLKQADEFPLPDGTMIRIYDVEPTFPTNPENGRFPPQPRLRFEVGTHSWEENATFTTSSDMLMVISRGEMSPDSLQSFQLEFDRPLEELDPEDADKIAMLKDCGRTEDEGSCNDPAAVPITLEFDEEYPSRIVLKPIAGLTAGHKYVLKLYPSEIKEKDGDLTYIGLMPNQFEFSVRRQGGEPIATLFGGSIPQPRDLVQLGNLMVAGGPEHLFAVDTSTTTDGSYKVHSVSTTGGSHVQYRALATDGHNRVFYNVLIGETWTVRAAREEDIREAGTTCGIFPEWAEIAGATCFDPVEGYTEIAYALGHYSGMTNSEWLVAGAMPTGIPTDLEVLIQDENGEELGIREFFEAYMVDEDDPEPLEFEDLPKDEDGFYILDVPLWTTKYRKDHGKPEPSTGEVPEYETQRKDGCGPSEPAFDRYQRVTIENLSTGQSWSLDIENVGWPGGSGTGGGVQQIRARKGDTLRVRYNVTALGFVALMGSGITVVDLNRPYRVPKTGVSFDRGQCGRHLAYYQGGDIEFDSCADALAGGGVWAPPDGIWMTPAVSPHSKKRCSFFDQDSCSYSEIDVYSPVVWNGVVQSTTQTGDESLWPWGEDDAAGDLQFKDLKCLRGIYQVGAETKEDGSKPVLQVRLRDTTLATDVTWIQTGVEGQLDGIFKRKRPHRTRESDPGSLLFVSMGAAGIYVFDITDGSADLIGHLFVDGHEIYRLQADKFVNRLFAGGFDEHGRRIIDVWDLRTVNGAPEPHCTEEEEENETCIPGTASEPRPLTTIVDVAWITNNIGVSHNGTGLIYSWNGGAQTTSVPFDSPHFRFMGLYLDDNPAHQPDPPKEGEPIPPKPYETRGTSMLVPLGIPTEITLAKEEENADANEKDSTAAFRVRVALPGDLGPTVKARVQSLRALPGDRYLGQVDVGKAVAMPGGPGWPETEVTVTLKRLWDVDKLEKGRHSTAYELYESEEIVLLLADPRARRDYTKQDITEGDLADKADEEAQCRRCDYASYLPDPEAEEPDQEALDNVLEMLAGGPYVRVYLSPDDGPAAQFFIDQGENYPPPSGWTEVAGWADFVPAPMQASLAEPPLNPAMWSPGEAGVAASLATGDLLYSATDHAVPGRGLSFSFDRSYRSGTLGYGPLGAAGWNSNVFAHLRLIKTTGEVEYHDGSGRVVRFIPVKTLDGEGNAVENEVPEGYTSDDTDQYLTPKGVYLRLINLPGGTGWKLLGQHNDSLIFDAEGRLSEIRDRLRQNESDHRRQGNTIRLSNDVFGQLVSVADDLYRPYTFAYNEDPSSIDYGLLTSIKDFAKRQIRYEYGTDDRRLEKVVLPSVTNRFFSDYNHPTPTITYEYSSTQLDTPAVAHAEFSPLRLTKMTPPEAQVPRFTVKYDDLGRMEGVDYPEGVLWKLRLLPEEAEEAYPVTGADVTAPWGQEHSYILTPANRLQTFSQRSVPTLLPHEDDPWSSGSGTISTPTRDLHTRFHYFIGREEERWDDGRLQFLRPPDGSQRQYYYRDEDDRLLGAAVRNVIHFAAQAAKGPVSYSEVRSGFNYDEGSADNYPGRIKIDGLSGLVATGVHNPSEPSSVSGFLGSGAIESMDYNSHGQVTKVESGSGGFLGFGRTVEQREYSYEIGRNSYEYGKLKYEYIGQNRLLLHTYEYDTQGNLKTSRPAWGGAGSSTAYDEWDRPIQSITGKGGIQYTSVDAELRSAYDARGRLVVIQQKQSGIPNGWVETSYDYDERDQIKSIKTDHLATETPGATANAEGTMWFGYSAGLLTSTTSAKGITTNHEYYPGSDRVRATYRSGDAGKLFQAQDPMGRVVLRTDGHEGFWRGRYDAWGRLYSEALPDGLQVRRMYRQDGALVEETGFTREDLGGEEPEEVVHAKTTFKVDDSGVTTEQTETIGSKSRITKFEYDRSGRLEEVTRNGRLDSKLEYMTDLTGRLSWRRDAIGNITYFVYPGTSPWFLKTRTHKQLAAVDNPAAGEIPSYSASGVIVTNTFARDALGRVTRQYASSNSQVTKFTYDEPGNLLEIASDGATRDRQTFTYDSRGSLLSVTRDGSATPLATFGYDIDGRLKTKKLKRNGFTESTIYDYDDFGRLEDLDFSSATATGQPYSFSEGFSYYPDDTPKTHTTRLTNALGQPLELLFSYDKGNRLLSRTIVNADAFIEDDLPSGLFLLDSGDSYSYDALSRPASTAAVTADGSSPAAAKVTNVYAQNDPRPLPTTQSVNSVGSVVRSFDLFDVPETTMLPQGLHDLGFVHDGLDRRLAAYGLAAYSDLAAGYQLIGSATVAGVMVPGSAAMTAGQTFDPADGFLTRKDIAVAGQPLLSGFMGYVWNRPDTLKLGRTTWEKIGDELSFSFLTNGQGWIWKHDQRQRLETAIAGVGPVEDGALEPKALRAWSFGYGPADELEKIALVDDLGMELITEFDAGPHGRTDIITDLWGFPHSLTYDSAGRRIEDERFTYTYDWRGRLMVVETKDEEPQKVEYKYDATGRLIKRTVLEGESFETFVEARGFVWDGWSLSGEYGLNYQDQRTWRAQYLPGPRGLDDSPVLRIDKPETENEPATTEQFALLRDEVGTVIAVTDLDPPAQENEEPPAAGEVLMARYLYTPYGEAHLELGPEFLRIDFDPEITSVVVWETTISQSEPVEELTLPGGVWFQTTMALDEESHLDGVRILVLDEGEWLPADHLFEIGTRAEDPNVTDIMPLGCWPAGAHYRIQIGIGLKDIFGRPLQLPPDETGYVEFYVEVPEPAIGDVIAEARSFDLIYDNRIAARLGPDSADPIIEELHKRFPGGQPSLFQGLWTDPVTGLSYARNRWYDARTASWLSNDPAGAFDSENLYSFVGWQPSDATDPLGLFSMQDAGVAWDWSSDFFGKILKDVVTLPVTLIEYQTDYQDAWAEAYDTGGWLGVQKFERQQRAIDEPWRVPPILGSIHSCMDAMAATDSRESAELTAECALRIAGDAAIAKGLAGGLRGGARQSVSRIAPRGGGRWRVPKDASVEEIRAAYNTHVDRLGPYAETMLSRGASAEHVARRVHLARRLAGMRYKAATPFWGRMKIYYRNRAPSWFPPVRMRGRWMGPKGYDSIYGPSVDWLRAHRKTWEQIIESATRTNRQLNETLRTRNVAP